VRHIDDTRREPPQQRNYSRHDRHGSRRARGGERLYCSIGCAPPIERAFHTDLTTAQWVINGYAMVFGVVIVTGGAWLTCSDAGVSFLSEPQSSLPFQ
jgi:hypothetical protein